MLEQSEQRSFSAVMSGLPRLRAHLLSSGKSLRAFLRWVYRRRSIRVTSIGLPFVLLTLAIGVAALNTGNNLLYMLLAMMLSMIVVSGMLSEKCLKQLSIERRLPSQVFAGVPAAIALRVTNEKPRFPSFSLRMTDVVCGALQDSPVQILHLPAKGTLAQSYRVLFPRRGRYRIEAVNVSTRFPFGLFVKTARLPPESEVIVYPTPQHLPEALLQALQAMGHDEQVSRRGLGAGLYNLRDYQPGDDSRSVHWKTSARQSRLIVRETEAEDQRLVTLALPICAPVGERAEAGDALERAIVLTASVAAHFQRQGFAMRLLVGEEELRFGSGDGHFCRMLRMLALCRLSLGSEAPIPSSFLTLPRQAAMGQFVLLVLPWEDQSLRAACRGVSRILEAWT